MEKQSYKEKFKKAEQLIEQIKDINLYLKITLEVDIGENVDDLKIRDIKVIQDRISILLNNYEKEIR